jgi:hypothetical protein
MQANPLLEDREFLRRLVIAAETYTSKSLCQCSIMLERSIPQSDPIDQSPGEINRELQTQPIRFIKIPIESIENRPNRSDPIGQNPNRIDQESTQSTQSIRSDWAKS